MADPLPSLDLRLTPDWLKESESANRYADYADEDPEGRGHRGRRERRDDRPRRPNQNRQRRDAGSGRRETTGPNRPGYNRGRPGLKANRAEIRPPVHILRELQTDPVGAGMNRFRNKSNRQPFRWTFCRRNALSRK